MIMKIQIIQLYKLGKHGGIVLTERLDTVSVIAVSSWNTITQYHD